MPFPISISGSLLVDATDCDAALTVVQRMIDNERPASVFRFGSRIEFSNGFISMLRPTGRSLFRFDEVELGIISNGEIEAARDPGGIRLSYRLSFVHSLAFVTLGVTFFFGPPVMAAPNLRLWAKIGILSFAWLWLFGANYALMFFQFPKFIRSGFEAIDESRKKA